MELCVKAEKISQKLKVAFLGVSLLPCEAGVPVESSQFSFAGSSWSMRMFLGGLTVQDSGMAVGFRSNGAKVVLPHSH